jgi:hypothetical protein
MTTLDDLTRTGTDLVVRSARRTARRAALSATLWAMALVFLCLMLGFGAVGLFLLLTVTQGAITAAFSVAAIAGVFALVFVLVAVNPAAGHEPSPSRTDPTDEQNRTHDRPTPETTAMVMSAGFLSGLFSGEK